MRLLAGLGLLVLLAAPLRAQDAGQDAPYPLSVRAGEELALCSSGTIQCPATAPICDDTAVAVLENAAEGLVLRGLKPGRTLCSAAANGGLRRVYRVTVRR